LLKRSKRADGIQDNIIRTSHMHENRLTAWFRRGAALLGAAGLLALTACGGGSGAPNNPYTPTPPIAGPLVVVPGEATAFAGTPLILSISGGTPPYQAFSSNPSALPVPQNVNGNTLALMANNVDATQSANVTIRDAAGQTAISEISVRPAVLLPASVAIVPNSAPCPGGDVCSGQTSVATLRVTGPTGAGLAGRQVRFDVIQGAFSLQTTNPASPLAQTQTVVSDANGEARVVIAVAPNTPTQIGLLRATELATGSQTTSQFVIAQVTNGEGVLSVAPSGNTIINGPAQGVCSAGVRVSYYIFGGTPPYRIATQFPDAVTIIGNPVTVNGGGFDVLTNGSCFTGLTFAITDATGRTLTTGLPTIDNVAGTQTPPPTPPPVANLQLFASGTGTAQSRVACANRTFAMTVVGAAPFSATSSLPGVILNSPVSTSPGQLNVQFPNSLALPPATDVVIRVGDANTPQQLAAVTIFCQ
jgi:hypothetical protein